MREWKRPYFLRNELDKGDESTLKKTYLLFDAGGTLLFPKFDWIASLLTSKGIKVSPLKIFEEFSRLNHEIDVALRDGKKVWDNGDFVRRWLVKLSIPRQIMNEMVQTLINEERERGLWAYTFQHVKGTLEKLKEMGYSMSVISNSDGRVEKMMNEVGIAKYFDRIYDSYIVGVSKPDVRIYKLALEKLSLKPNDALFVGDMFYIDVLGANSCDIPALHLDPFEYYKNWEGARIKGVEELPELLEKADLKDEKFFPFAKN